MARFPDSLPDTTFFRTDIERDTPTEFLHALHHNRLAEEVISIARTLGTNVEGTHSSVKNRLSNIESTLGRLDELEINDIDGLSSALTSLDTRIMNLSINDIDGLAARLDSFNVSDLSGTIKDTNLHSGIRVNPSEQVDLNAAPVGWTRASTSANNRPSGSTGNGSILTLPGNNSGKTQIYWENNGVTGRTPNIYARTYDGSTWTTWKFLGPAETNTITIGTVTSGTPAGATITGTPPNQVLNLTLPQGDKGNKGDKGDQGTSIRTGSSSPSGTAGTGDLHINTSNGKLYEYNGTSWIEIGNVTGPPGETGPQGIQGDEGEPGKPKQAGDGLQLTGGDNDVIEVDNTVVRTTGDQTVAGKKTFTDATTFSDDVTFDKLPVLPSGTPTSNNQAARKKYVDDAINTAKYSAGDGLDLTGTTMAVDSTVVRTGRKVSAGSGLTGGGDLSNDRTLGIANEGVETGHLADEAATPEKTSRINIRETSSSTSVGAGDLDGIVRINSPSDRTLTFRNNSNESLPNGFTVQGNRAGTGKVTTVAEAGVTLIWPDGETVTGGSGPNIASQHGSLFGTKLDTNLWLLDGNLE